MGVEYEVFIAVYSRTVPRRGILFANVYCKKDATLKTEPNSPRKVTRACHTVLSLRPVNLFRCNLSAITLPYSSERSR